MPSSLGVVSDGLQYPLLPLSPLVCCGSRARRLPPGQRGQVSPPHHGSFFKWSPAVPVPTLGWCSAGSWAVDLLGTRAGGEGTSGSRSPTPFAPSSLCRHQEASAFSMVLALPPLANRLTLLCAKPFIRGHDFPNGIAKVFHLTTLWNAPLLIFLTFSF